MAKLKSAYRPKAEIPQSDCPANVEPQREPELKPEAVIAAEPKSDTPTVEPKISGGSEQGRRSGHPIARAACSNPASRSVKPPSGANGPATADSRDEKLAFWKAHGAPDDQIEFLQEHPAMIDYSELTVFSAEEAAKAGHERGSAEHMRATKELFDQHMDRLKQQAASNGADHLQAPQPTPEFFRPPPPRRQQASPRSTIVSAPVSRETPGTRAYEAENDPSKVRLRPDQREAAAIAGVSETEYAKQLLRMKKMQASGEIQG
jgi:hypothetical protein